MFEAETTVSTKLQEVLEKLLSDPKSTNELVATLDETRSRLSSLQGEFHAGVATESDGVRMAVRDEIQAVQQSFSDYQAVLSTLDGYLAEFDAAFLKDAHQNLPFAIERLNLDFVRYREAILAERGPSTHSGINHLLGLALASQNDEAVLAALERQREAEFLRIDAGVEGLLDEAALPHLEPAVQQFLDHYAELLNAEDFASEDWQQRLRDLGREYARIDVQFLSRRYGHGPTAVSQINLVINSAWLFQQGAVERAVVAYYLEAADVALQEILAGHLQLQRSLPEDDRQFGNATLAAEGCDALLLCIEEYWNWLDSPSEDGLKGLFERASEAASKVEAGFQALSAVSVDGVACTICGSRNEQGISRCRTCGAALSGASESGFSVVEGGTVADDSPFGSALRFQAVLAVAEQVFRREVAAEALLEECDQLSIALDLAKKSSKGSEAVQANSEQEKGRVKEATSHYNQAMSEMADAIEELRSFAEAPNQDSLDQARSLLELVAERLAEVEEQRALLSTT